ncbi:MAG: DAK2 domain-containing protein [Actinomycetota bacterium]|nr:DAK2 domain-containing protein [Actinomycetota bacterium]MEC9059531.1 DAK2 domain-containing protein [Actinomycetota bacterium]MED5362163.1 DAK2 domain-containing protein [Actinomycetota bacterium]MEE3255672.1 DAK2 domain-containing protein [Actinomycetota bacterium]
MESVSVLTTAHIVETLSAFHAALEDHKESINRLNVYPVPDGDTGTNMFLTVASVLEEIQGVDLDDREAVCAALSHGSLMGARGNSGVILSQVLRGMSHYFAQVDEIDAEALATALSEASVAADGAVMKPVEGTILTVVREVARAAQDTASDSSILETVEHALEEGEVALERTPEQLDVLREAGVVDAGGAGFLLFLHALLSVIDGRDLPEAPTAEELLSPTDRVVVANELSELRYEVMYLLHAADDTIEEFKNVWAGFGDSIVVVGGDGLWNCHIHTNDIGPAIEAGIEIGRPERIRVTDLSEEVMEERWVREAAEAGQIDGIVAADAVPCAVVAVSPAAGISRIFHSLGVQELVLGGQSMNPSTSELLDAVERAPGDEVVILPNNSNIVAVAQAVDAETEKIVVVIPTTSIPEGFASLLGYDPQTTAAQNSQTMLDVARGVKVGEVTQAIRPTSTAVGEVATGDWIGLDRNGIGSIGATLVQAATALLEQLVDERDEILSVIVGDEASDADTRSVTEWVRENRPGVETEVHHGGQSHYPFFFGVE